MYPAQACGVVEVPIWDEEKADRYCTARINLHKESELLEDDKLPSVLKKNAGLILTDGL